MYNSQTVVDRIKDTVKAKGSTMSDLNQYCDIDKSTINMSAQKKYGLSAKILYDVSSYLECSVDYLIGRTDTPTPAAPSLSPIEERLLSAFRSMPPDEQLMLIGRAEHIAEQEKTA